MKKKPMLFILPFVLISSFLWSKTYEFIDQDIHEILFVLSLEEKITIMGDKSFNGKTSFRAVGNNFEEIFDLFLAQNRLYVNKTDDVWIVSKMRIFCDDENLVQVDAFDQSPQYLFEKLSELSGTSIFYDIIPTQPISVHVSNISVKDLVSLIMSAYGNYIINDEANILRIYRDNQNKFDEALQGYCKIEKHLGNEKLYSAEISRAQGKNVLEKLCEVEGREAVFLNPCNTIIDAVQLKGKSFDDLLSLFCVQLYLTVIEKDSVLYFVESQDSLFNVKNFGKSWELYTLENIKSNEFSQFLQSRFESLRYYHVNSRSLFILANEKTHQEISSLIPIIDCTQKAHLVCFDYIRSDDFLSSLPPGFKGEDFYKTGNDGALYFIGTEKNYENLLCLLKNIDLPQKQILYDILVLQVQSSKNFSWEPSLTAKTIEMGDRSLISADLSSVLDLQTNVLSTLGINFAMKLQTALNESKAKIFADTSLHGISGVPINFQNTNTYRYKDIAINPETGNPMFTGVTREIVSGLFLDIEGWVSGQGMITTKVKATISKRGADVSSSVGNPPPTFEKIITTEVQSESGVPVILSGLIQDDSVLIEQRSPLISKIPFLGKLFTSSVNTREKTEMHIYLIPRLVEENSNAENLSIDSTKDKLKSLSKDIFNFVQEVYK